MVSWLWFWAPQVHFPWSGSLAQNIAPNTSWFSDLIQPGAGNARIEAQAFATASYGKQLGLITEVLLDVAQGAAALSPEAAKALQSLQTLKLQIDAIKRTEYAAAAASLVDQLTAMRERGGAEYDSVVQRLRPLLG